MSLLLLFNGIPTAPVDTSWHRVVVPSSSWAQSNWDFYNVWGEWANVTWGYIQSSGLSWNQMGGYMFVSTSSKPSTAWISVTH